MKKFLLLTFSLHNKFIYKATQYYYDYDYDYVHLFLIF